MSDESDNTNDRLEGLLRRWGANEAAQQAAPAAMPPARPAGGAVWAVMRYLAVGAAAAVFLGAVLVMVGRIGKPPVDLAQSRPSIEQFEALRSDLAEARQAVADLQRQAVEERHVLGETISQMYKDHEAETLALRQAGQEADAARAALTKELDEARRRFAETLAAETGGRDERIRALAEQVAGRKGELEAARLELATLRTAGEKGLAERKDLQQELASLRRRQAEIEEQFQRAYLAAAAPGETGIRAAQTAARQARLAERAAEVRGLAQSEATAQLAERLEVVLLRLDLLNPDDYLAARAFATLLVKGGLTTAMDAALADSTEPVEVRMWLMQARAVLAGASHVG